MELWAGCAVLVDVCVCVRVCACFRVRARACMCVCVCLVTEHAQPVVRQHQRGGKTRALVWADDGIWV